MREIFVPLEDLNVILQSDSQRVFMEREEYETLVEQANRTAEAAPPHAYSMASADYEIVVEDGRAVILGKLVIDVTSKGVQARSKQAGNKRRKNTYHFHTTNHAAQQSYIRRFRTAPTTFARQFH